MNINPSLKGDWMTIIDLYLVNQSVFKSSNKNYKNNVKKKGCDVIYKQPFSQQGSFEKQNYLEKKNRNKWT